MNKDKWFTVNYMALVALLTIIAVVVLRLAVPAQFPSLLFLIPVFFCLTLGIMHLVKRSCEKKNRDRAFFFMEYRMIKLFLSLIFIAVYILVVKECLMSFAVTFVVFYFAIMTFETVHFIKAEKKS